MLEGLHDAGPLRGALSWVGPRFGAIRRLAHTASTAPEPAFHVYDAELARVPAGTPYSASTEIAAGVSLDPDEALRRALGEAVERYCGLHAPAAELVEHRPWSSSALSACFPRCAEDEPCPASLRHAPTDALVPHVRVHRLDGGEDEVVPAAHVYPATPRGRGEPLVALGISTGLAFHSTLHDALWSGLCEVAERDAVMSMWWTRGGARRIDTTHAPDALQERLRRLRAVDIEARLFDINTDFETPTVFCVLLGPDYPRVLSGASCTSEPLRACTKAIDEALGVRHYVRQEDEPALPCDGATDARAFDWVHALADHVRLYGVRGPTPAFDFLLRDAATMPFETFASRPYWPAPQGMRELAQRAQQLHAQGLNVLWAELTTEDAAPLGHVVRVVVPEMVPLSPDHRIRWLGTPRLWKRAGHEHRSAALFNPAPHPFG